MFLSFLTGGMLLRAEMERSGYDPEKADEEGLWPCVLIEIEPSPPNGARVVWEWNAWDHLIVKPKEVPTMSPLALVIFGSVLGIAVYRKLRA